MQCKCKCYYSINNKSGFLLENKSGYSLSYCNVTNKKRNRRLAIYQCLKNLIAFD